MDKVYNLMLPSNNLFNKYIYLSLTNYYNLYYYNYQNPTIFLDPFGENPVAFILGVIGAITLITSLIIWGSTSLDVTEKSVRIHREKYELQFKILEQSSGSYEDLKRAQDKTAEAYIDALKSARKTTKEIYDEIGVESEIKGMIKSNLCPGE